MNLQLGTRELSSGLPFGPMAYEQKHSYEASSPIALTDSRSQDLARFIQRVRQLSIKGPINIRIASPDERLSRTAVLQFSEGPKKIQLSSGRSDDPLIAVTIEKAPPYLVTLSMTSNGNSLESELNLAGLIYSFKKSGGYELKLETGETLSHSAEFTDLEPDRFYFELAALWKLHFFEKTFGRSFSLPFKGDLAMVELLFRGITEGEFWVRGSSIVVRVENPEPLLHLSEAVFDTDDLGIPLYYPVTVPGIEEITTVRIPKATFSNSGVLHQIRDNPTTPIDIKFTALDQQIQLRFERFADKKKLARMSARLKQFLFDASRTVPSELVALVNESLFGPPTDKDVRAIAFGWMFFHKFPNAFSPQKPIREENTWRVPVWLAYITGEGTHVGDLTINPTTGKVIDHTPIEEMYARGDAYAEQIDDDW